MIANQRSTLATKIRQNFWFWIACLMIAALPLVIGLFFVDTINVKLDKKMTCTVESTKVVSETHTVGNGNGSSTSVVVESKDCPEVFFDEMPDGIQGTDGLQQQLQSGHRYTFVYAYIKFPMDTTKVYSFTEA